MSDAPNERLGSSSYSVSGQGEVVIPQPALRRGLEVLWDSGIVAHESEADLLIIKRVIRSVLRASGYAPRIR